MRYVGNDPEKKLFVEDTSLIDAKGNYYFMHILIFV